MRRWDARTLFCVWRKEISNPQKAQKKIRAPGEKGTHEPTLLTSARLVPMFDCYVSVKLAAVLSQWVYATGRQEEEDGRTLVCDKRDKAISYVFCRDLHLTSMFSGLSQKDLFKGRWILAKSYFKQNYCHACHTRFAVFFPLPFCCVSSLCSVSDERAFCIVFDCYVTDNTHTKLRLVVTWVLFCLIVTFKQ